MGQMEYIGDASCEFVAVPVSLYPRHFSFLARMGGPVFHAQHSPVALLVNVFENIPVIHFPGGRFITSGVITDLKIADLAVGMVDVAYKVALVALYMVHV